MKRTDHNPPPRALTLALLLALMLATPAACTSNAPDHAHQTQTVQIDGQQFNLELALTPQQRQQGLSDREHIPDDGGMLFVFPDVARRQFVMRRCLVPIDIIFLGPNGRIVAMHQMAVEPYDLPEEQLTRYSSHYPAQFAIELQGGMLDQLTVGLGDRIDLPLESLKRRAD